MSEWITDRRPTEDDCVGVDRIPGSYHVWVMYEGKVVTCPFEDVVLGCPWQPIEVPAPEPYVKPKRWTVVWSELFGGWTLREMKKGGCVQLFDPTLKCGLNRYDDEHREAAERIAAIYEEVMP